jgi:phosphopantetheinyl transferase
MAAWLGGEGCDYVLSAPEDAAPVWLDGPESIAWQDVSVSLSHSGNWVACALARHSVGVDIECSGRMRDFEALGGWIYPESELQAFLQLSTTQQRQAFYTQWALKESWIKEAGASQVQKNMQSISFVPGAGVKQAIVAQIEDLILALYPASLATTIFVDAELVAMQWVDWAWSSSDSQRIGL